MFSPLFLCHNILPKPRIEAHEKDNINRSMFFFFTKLQSIKAH